MSAEQIEPLKDLLLTTWPMIAAGAITLIYLLFRLADARHERRERQERERLQRRDDGTGAN